MRHDSRQSGDASDPASVGTAGVARESVSGRLAPPPSLDDAQLEADLAEAAHLVAAWKRTPVGGTSQPTGKNWLADAPHAALPAWHVAANAAAQESHASAAKSTEPAAVERHPLATIGSWLLVALGLMAFACGGVLLGWSIYQGRDDLWRIGLPLVLGGQAALIFGVVLQLDGLWQSNQETARSLDTLDSRMQELRQNTAALSASHSGPSTAFYAHLAGGASPHILLSDLKGQLDMLAMRMQK